MLKQILSDHM